MKANRIIGIAMIAGALLFFASAKSQNVELEQTQKIYEAILAGKCDEAQKYYETWKALTGSTDADIEKMIDRCLHPNTSYDDNKITDVPNTKLIVTRNAIATQVAWEDASMICRSLRFNGSDKWRLPTRKELTAIYKSNILEIKTTSKHMYIWGEVEGEEENPHYPALDLITGNISLASDVSTIGCYCVTEKNSK
ncbi:MAG: DUF1566 domain-containing protein [Bacteroidales bacterium]|nr:DUF1566 domain-containing protein [Bacteroidales bacterium]